MKNERKGEMCSKSKKWKKLKRWKTNAIVMVCFHVIFVCFNLFLFFFRSSFIFLILTDYYNYLKKNNKPNEFFLFSFSFVSYLHHLFDETNS